MHASIPILSLLVARLVLATDTEASGIEACTNTREGGNSCDAITMLQAQTRIEKPIPRLMQDSETTDLDVLLEEGEATDLARRESNGLAQHFAGLASQSTNSITQELFESFQLCGQCSSFKRFGEAHDGGYLMCMDGFKGKKVKAAYSFGVEHHDQWSEDVVKELGVAVNQFDCTVDSSDCAGCKFFKTCITSADGLHPGPKGKEYDWSVLQALQNTSQASAPDGSLLLKMDIEGSEWPIYASEPSDTLKKFGQLLVEFHWIEKEDKHVEYLQAMKNLLAAGFKVAHLHGNNFAGMYNVESRSIPNVLEVTFVTGPARSGGCSSIQDYQSLDATNNVASNELPLAKLTG
jgi:hypothetical protein